MALDTDQEVPDKKGKDKIKRERSIQYPFYDLKKCIDFVKIIDQLGGRKGASYNVLLSHMGITSIRNKRFSYLISSAEQFGLITRVEHEINLTDRARYILYPVSGEEQKNSLIIECFKSPNIYNILINQYNNRQLPSDEILKNLFIDLKISKSVVDHAVNAFVKSGEYAGLIDKNRNLITTSQEQREKTVPLKEDIFDEEPRSNQKTDKEAPIETPFIKLEWPISPGKVAFLKIPRNSSKEDIEKLKNLLDALL